MPTIAELLTSRISNIDAEIARVQQAALAQIADLRADKQLLVQAQTVLAKAPEIEALLPALKKLGAI